MTLLESGTNLETASHAWPENMAVEHVCRHVYMAGSHSRGANLLWLGTDTRCNTCCAVHHVCPLSLLPIAAASCFVSFQNNDAEPSHHRLSGQRDIACRANSTSIVEDRRSSLNVRWTILCVHTIMAYCRCKVKKIGFFETESQVALRRSICLPMMYVGHACSMCRTFITGENCEGRIFSFCTPWHLPRSIS